MLKRVFFLLAAALVAAAPLRADEAPAVPQEVTRLEYRAPAQVSPYREHAPLALFSLGSLAMGGVFYGIHRSLDYPDRSAVSGDGTRVDMAIGAAGISAVAAGAAYLWYTLRADRSGASGWTETVAAGVTSEGAVAASVTVPLSALVD